ncbi:MAG: NAD(P)-dependent oxidoreductase [Lachnospiraceae bacterium]|nr:NAD(P)-dependent oxidoreductase [Lachnospiraceae bacterium]
MNHKSGSPEQPSCVLLCGKTELLDYETLKQIAQYYNVVVSGERINRDIYRRKLTRKIHIYNEDPTSENFKKIAYAYSPDVIWYFSGFADGGDGLDNESRKIERLIECCVANEVQKLIIISSINSLNYTPLTEQKMIIGKEFASPRSFDCAKMEELVSFNAGRGQIRTVIVRAPYISGRISRNNYLSSIFATMMDNGAVSFPYNEKQMIDFFSLRDLCELLISITEETMDSTGEYTVLSGYQTTYGEFGSMLKGLDATVKLEYDRPAVYDLVLNKEREAQRVRESYGFIAADNVLDGLDEAYREYSRNVVKKSALKEKLGKFLTLVSDNTLKFAELIILFIAVQYLLKYTSDSVYFKYIDLRLFFVVILGMTHGMHIGILAGVLECISLVLVYRQTGVNGMMLFYNVDYWLPFAIYLMTGAITGYITTAKNQKISFMEQETAALQDKYMFLNNVYMSVIDNKEEYKRQILGYQDSFGKIFEAVEKLDSSVPADIFMNGVNTLERILNNRSIAIYTMDEWQKYLRLVACSREMMARLTNSVSIDDFRIIYDEILDKGTWKNTDFAPGLPMYAYGIVEDGKVRLMICLFEAGPEQMGLYYMNLFTILCSLIRVSFIRALEYQQAIEDEKYYRDTEVLIPSFFEDELNSQRKMAEAGVASYILLQIEESDVTSFNDSLKGLIRHSDIAGAGYDGNYYLLLTQTNRDIVGIVGKRLTEHEIKYTVVEGM